MDQLFVELIGKPKPKSPKIITVVAENFSIIEEQARFLKTVLAIPLVKQLPLDANLVRLIQIGPVHCDIKKLADKANWTIDEYESSSTFDEICITIQKRYLSNAEAPKRYLLFINNLSILELTKNADKKRIIELIEKLKVGGNFVVGLYQNHSHTNETKPIFLRDLEYISDAYVSNMLCKSIYYQAIWYQTIPEHHTLLPGKVDTSYYTCKIGKFYYSPDLLCFYERKKVPRTYDPELEASKTTTEGSRDTDEEVEDEEEVNDDALRSLSLNQEKDDSDDISSTLPYTKAQDPQKSRIFYYPERDEDILGEDEEDPDNDLSI